MTSRIVVLPEDAEDRKAPDEATAIFDLRAQEIRPSFEVSFVRHYDAIRAAVSDQRSAGLLVLAVAPGLGVRGHLWLGAEADLRSAVVGRHTWADLFLPGDRDLSLRHLMLLVRGEPMGVRIRVLDLRTGSGFEDESGRRLEGVAATGPVFLAAARYQLFLFPTPLATVWPDDPHEAWAKLPPRVVVTAEEKRAPPTDLAMHDFLAQEVLRRHLNEGGVITQVRGPVPLGRRLMTDDDDPRLGTLIVQNWMLDERLPVGVRAAERGILLGRYARCDSAALSVFGSDRISRVHALLVRDGEDLWLVDTASKNGIWRAGVRVSLCRLDPGVPLEIGGRVRLTWEPTVH